MAVLPQQGVALWMKMQQVALSTGNFVKLTLYTDGSGRVEHNEVERNFGSLRVAHFYIDKLLDVGFMP
jgi:hypothetical protein